MDSFKQFVKEYEGALIGAAIGILILLTRLYYFIVCVVVICACVFAGNYVQRNKAMVKEKLKNLIDKM